MAKGRRQKKAGPVTADAYIEKAQALLEHGELEEARECFEHARQMRQDDTNILDALADVSLQLGEPEQALQVMLKTIQCLTTMLAGPPRLILWHAPAFANEHQSS